MTRRSRSSARSNASSRAREARTPSSRWNAFDDELSGRALRLEVGAADDPVAPEERKDVVAVPPLRRGLVDLDQVVEAEVRRAKGRSQRRFSNGESSTAADGRGGRARCPPGRVPGRRRPRRRAARARRRRRGRRPPRIRATRPPDASARRSRARSARPAPGRRAARACAGARAPPAGRVEDSRRQRRAREVVEPLEPLPARDDELAVVPEELEHLLRGLPAPHLALAAAPSKWREPSGPRARISSMTCSRRCGCVRSTAPYQRRPPFSIAGRKSGQSSGGGGRPRGPSTRSAAPLRGVARPRPPGRRRSVRRGRSGGSARRSRSSRAARTRGAGSRLSTSAIVPAGHAATPARRSRPGERRSARRPSSGSTRGRPMRVAHLWMCAASSWSARSGSWPPGVSAGCS